MKGGEEVVMEEAAPVEVDPTAICTLTHTLTHANPRTFTH